MNDTSSGDASVEASATSDASPRLSVPTGRSHQGGAPVSPTAPKGRLTSRDLLRFEMMDDPQLSPDGTEIAWVRTWIDAASNRYRSQICLTSLDSGATRPLTPGSGLELQPRWSPDGRFVAFVAPPLGRGAPANGALAERAVSVVGRGMQLWIVAASGGEPQQLTALAGGVQSPAWSPDGRRLAFISYVEPARGLEALDEPPPDTPYERFNRDVLVARRLDWKMDGVGYVGDYRRMVGWIPFQASAESSQPPVTLLTCGEFDVFAIAWSPDGATVAAIGTLAAATPSRQRAIYLLDPEALAPTAVPEPLFCLEDVRHAALAWSPDGSRVALYGHDDATIGHYGNQQLWIVNVASGEGRCLTRHLDRTWANAVWTDVGRYGGDEGPCWSTDGRHLFGLLSSDGAVRLCRVDSESGHVDALTPPDEVVAAFTVDAQGERAALLRWAPLAPAALWSLDLRGGGAMRPLLDPNEALLETLCLATPERFTFESGGETIEGWVLPPVQAEADESYPTILYHGGGPGGMRAGNFIFEYQLYAAAGYGVLYINTRGCQGYGEAFCTAILGDWGGADHEDNMRGLEVACQRFSWIDPARLLTAGGSYGGYQVNWILGREHRFKAAVSDRSVFNRFSSYGTSDIGFLREFEFDDGPPWETPAAYLRQSPLTFLAEARTPTLVVHSAMDLRCPVEQGEQLYLALKRLGVPTELVRFPNESHGLSRSGRPWHRVYRLDRYLEWFARWLG